MATNFPTSIDSYTTKIDATDYPQAADVNNPQDAIVALETKVGINGSGTNTSLDYKLASIGTGQVARPVGEITMYGAASAPTGWLLCDGAAVSQATYASLYGVIGSTYNTGGEGGGNFRLPNLKSNVPVGYNSGDTNFNALGKTGGEATHTLTGAESGTAVHGHGVTDPTHRHSVNAAAQGPTYSGSGTAAQVSSTNTGYAATGLTVNNSAAANAVNAHNNIQPYITLQFIIKY